MRVLVTAASKHGATEEIAERIGAVLTAHGVEVDVKQLQEVSGLGGYEAVVLGSGIYLGKWLKEARRFVEVHAAELAQRPTWLFASGSITGDPPVGDDPNAMGAGLVEWLVETTQARAQAVCREAGPAQAGLGRAGVGAHGPCQRGRLPRLAGDRRLGSRDRPPAPARPRRHRQP
jgi:menaquinone-dependent protoporphyrinogen IX oxidase